MSHESAAGWTEAGRWREFKRSRRKYEGASGREAVRFLTKDVPLWISHEPKDVDETDLWSVVRGLRARAAERGHTFRDNSIRAYLDSLASFLKWKGNYIVQSSEIKAAFPKRATDTPVASAAEWEHIQERAIGEERIVTAFLWPNRRVEIRNARCDDFHPDRDPATWDARCKGGHGEVTDPDSPMTGTQVAELKWYLPWRGNRASQLGGVVSDSGHLIVRKAGTAKTGYRLEGVSDNYLNRLLRSAVERAYPDPARRPRLPGHSFRRGALTTLYERMGTQPGGVRWGDLKEIAHHNQESTTEGYVKSLELRRRLPTTIRLLDPPTPGAN